MSNKPVSKSSFLNQKFFDKSNIAIFCILGIMVGFLFPPALLSVFTFLFGVNAIRDVHPRKWLQVRWWLIGIAWVAIYALTYFWSVDKGNWGDRLQTKLAVLLLPLAFYFLPRFSAKQLQLITIIFAVAFLGSAFYSISFLIRDPAYYIHQYKVSDVLPTLPKRDHIRASLAIALFIIWGVYIWPHLIDKPVKWFVGSTIAILVVYLHILAAKSGLVSLYLFFIGWSFYMLFYKKKLTGLIIIIAIPVIFFLANKFMPTFHERVNYIDYTIFMLRHGDKSGQFGDNNRLYSYSIALDLIKQHPITGVGTGDIQSSMDTGYAVKYPEVPAAARLIPHNQFLVVGLGCGIPAMLLFCIWVFMPLASLRRNRQSFFFFMVWLILFIQLMIEPALEVQIGVFVYLFFLLLQKHELVE